MDNDVHIVFRETLAHLMVAADPELYWQFLSYETGQVVLYVQLQKALYSYLSIALLFYENLVGNLEAYGFRINSYDPCVANNVVGWKQLIVCWHVENLNISFVDVNEVTKMI